jgi:hypothetical protein
LLCSIRAPCLWTAEQQWYAIELKKKLDAIKVTIKAKYDRDVSASTLHGWLKPENNQTARQRKRPERCKAHKYM